MIKLGSVIWLAGVLAACSGNTTASPKGDATSTDVGATTTETSTTAGTDGTAENTANSTGASTTAGSGGSDPADECGGNCPPCIEGQRRYGCALLCVCEAVEDAARDEQEQLLSCDLERPCDPVGLQYTANAGSPIYGIYGAECLFSAFRDRTAGRFDVTYTGYAGFSVEHWEYVFVLDGSDTLLALRSGFFGGPGDNVRLGFGVESCTLADPSAFAECIAEPEGCLDANSWFDSCVDTDDARCPAE